MLGSNGNTYRYTSGMAMTGGRKWLKAPGFTFTYGFAEARVRVPKGKGLWPAFWLLPANYDWPPEIDIFEIFGDRPDRTTMDVHFAGGGNAGAAWSGPDFSAGWHTFGLDWSPSALIFYVDGVERWRFTDASRIPNVPMYPVFDLAIQGDNPPDATTPFPSYFDVDYVRVWQADTRA
jgi:beta-glucanase (GH16 family)